MTAGRSERSGRGATRTLWEAAVLTGGGSTRMGKEKALLDIDGRPLIERALKALGESFGRILVSVAQEGATEGVAAVVSALRVAGGNIALVPDLRPGNAGPLGAIEAVLGALEGPGAFVVAVDVPRLHGPLIRLLSKEAEDPDRLAVIPRWSRGLEPLYAVYRRDLLPRVSELLDRGERAAQSLAGESDVYVLDVEARLEESAPEEIFRNINTPEEYGRCRRERPGWLS